MRLPRTYRSSPPASQHIQYRRKSGSRPEPLLSPLIVRSIVPDLGINFPTDCFALRITNKNSDDPAQSRGWQRKSDPAGSSIPDLLSWYGLDLTTCCSVHLTTVGAPLSGSIVLTRRSRTFNQSYPRLSSSSWLRFFLAAESVEVKRKPAQAVALT